MPTHKLFLYGNHKPKIVGQDPGIWRRINMIPFTVKIPPEVRLPMSTLMARFRSELSGILNWAIEGYRDYSERGLAAPAEVKEATETYQHDQDALATFFEEHCEFHTTYNIFRAELYTAYKDWAKNNNEYVMSSRNFTK